MPLPITVPAAISPRPDELADVGVEGAVRRAGRLEGVAEVARAAADVEHGLPGEVEVAGQLADGVLGERRVEARRVGLLVAELPQQPDGAPEVGAPAVRERPVRGRRARHAQTLPEQSLD